MRTKRTIFSMVAVLSVFWLSLVFDIERPTSTVQGDRPAVEASAAVTADTTSEDSNSRVMSFSYGGGVTASYSNRLYDALLYDEAGTESDSIPETSDPKTSLTAPDAGDTPESAEDNPAEGLTASEAKAAYETIDTADSALTEQAAPEEEAAPSEYANIGISVASSYVNIRKKADTESEVLGKLFRDSAAEILDKAGDWYLVESGSVTGYVKADYIKTGIPDEELIAKYGELRIRVSVDGLNVREEPSTESDKLTVVYQNERYPVIELEPEWVKVDITDDRVIGYVRRDMIELIVDFKKAVSKEEEAELLRLQAEERAKQETAIKYRDEVDHTDDELKLLACLVHSEAGNQSYEGRLAVANVVLNRIKSSKYPNTIKAVIYQPGQFTVADSGSLAKQLANYGNYNSNSQKLSVKAAKAALAGANNIGSRLYFHSYKSAKKKGYDKKSNAVKIEDHLFW